MLHCTRCGAIAAGGDGQHANAAGVTVLDLATHFKRQDSAHEHRAAAGELSRDRGLADPVHIGGAKRASELSTDVGERLLQMHMTSAEEKMRARTIAEGLNKTFFAHGDAVSRSRARSLNLQIAKDNPALEKLMWQAFLEIEECMELRKSFNALEHFLANGGAAAVTPTAPVNLPPNAPAALANQIWAQVVQGAMNALAQPAVEVTYSHVRAMVESVRLASEFRVEGAIAAARVGGGEIQLSVTDKKTGWANVALPVAQPGAAPPVQAPGVAPASVAGAAPAAPGGAPRGAPAGPGGAPAAPGGPQAGGK